MHADVERSFLAMYQDSWQVQLAYGIRRSLNLLERTENHIQFSTCEFPIKKKTVLHVLIDQRWKEMKE